MDFETFLKRYGLKKEDLDENTLKTMRSIYDGEVAQRNNPPAPPAGNTPAAGNGEQAQARAETILNTARAAVATADAAIRGDIMSFAAELVGQPETSASDAQRKLSDRIAELVKSAPTRTGTADDQRTEVAIPSDPEAVLSKREICAAFGQAREDASVYDHAARSLLHHQERGGGIPTAELIDGLKEKTGRLVVHVENGGRPQRRSLTASSMNVAIQTVYTHLLRKSYDQVQDPTDRLVTVVPGGADEITWPEVEGDAGVKRLKEGEAYPILGSTERDVKSGYIKFGGAIAQTRENSLFDQLGRVMVVFDSLSRQLRNKKMEFRLARVCGSTAFDGRYIGRPGDDNGSTDFYSASGDHRGNTNLLASNALVDETDIDAVDQLLGKMKLLDGSFVNAGVRVILVPRSKKTAAWTILHSAVAPSIVATTGNPQVLNPYGPQGMYAEMPVVVSHPSVATYAGAETTWFAGDPSRQFYEVEHWPLEAVPVMASGEMALRDIVGAWKASWCSDILALSNMFFVKCTG